MQMPAARRYLEDYVGGGGGLNVERSVLVTLLEGLAAVAQASQRLLLVLAYPSAVS